MSSFLLLLFNDLISQNIDQNYEENNLIFDISSIQSVSGESKNSMILEDLNLSSQSDFFPNVLDCASNTQSNTSLYSMQPLSKIEGFFENFEYSDISSLKRPLSDFQSVLKLKPEKKKRSIYFTEQSSDKLFEHKHYFERLCFGLNPQQIQESDLVNFGILALQGISSDVFIWDSVKFCFKIQPVRIKTLSFLGLRQSLQVVANMGSLFKRLEIITEYTQLDLTYTGKCLQSCGQGLSHVMNWYKSCILDIPNILTTLVSDYSGCDCRITILNLIHHITPLKQRLEVLSEIFECDIQEKNANDEFSILLTDNIQSKNLYISSRVKQLPKGAKLINLMYEKIQSIENSNRPDSTNILLILLYYTFQPYLYWINKWIFFGELADDFSREFFIQKNTSNHCTEMWNAHIVDAQQIPSCILKWGNDIFTTGNTVGIIKSCRPDHYILKDFISSTIKSITILFTEQDLKIYELQCEKLQKLQHKDATLEMKTQLQQLEVKIRAQEERLKFGEELLDRFQEEENKLRDKLKKEILEEYRKKMNVDIFEESLNLNKTLNEITPKQQDEDSLMSEAPSQLIIEDLDKLIDDEDATLLMRVESLSVSNLLESQRPFIELPIEVATMRSIFSVLFQQKHMIDSIFVKMLFHDYRLSEYFSIINNFFLFRAGDFHDCFVNILHEGMKKGILYSDIYIVNRAMQEALKITGHAERDESIVSKLNFRIDESKVINFLDYNSVTSLDHLLLHYDIEFPVSLILTPIMMGKYASIHALLLKIKRIDCSLLDIWTIFKVKTRITNQRLKYLQLFRQEIQHFITVFKTFIFVEVIESSFSDFVKELLHQKDKDLNMERLLSIHQKFVDSLIKQCLLSTSAKPIMDIILKMFGLILKFKIQIENVDITDLPDTHYAIITQTRKEFIDCALFLDSLMDRVALQSTTSKFGKFRMNYKFTY
ncbi:predicted protein [Naegleria gruberi]|uniref:Spindle pole body component n=1 Tax=Naegleria gruberi TaxID=5762 RepID=D2UY41_NAEGR|nr:uncharacterized protein NAEGRDRAFT_61337 [Naegleria gruberi]EFC50408.1 predicted protein [Naegleria gruberi]|eukprot:XP_002683152.1 predicted protein [Naegleria gruberi strain NEG-M]